MRQTLSFLAMLLLLVVPQSGWSQDVVAPSMVPLWGLAEMTAVRDRIRGGDSSVIPALDRLRREADVVVKGRPVSITEKQGTGVEVPSGDPRDYISISIYYWPDERNPAAPWIKKDGVQNKEQVERYDTPRLRRAVDRVTTCSLAWWFTGDNKYAQSAVEQIRVWFLDEATRMNPNFAYAQFVPNRNGGKGNAHGLIDSRFFMEMLSAVSLLESGEQLTAADRAGLRAWFREYLDWCTTSDLGQQEAKASNNHAIYYDCQTLAYALYVGDRERARSIVAHFGPKRIATQVGTDGSLQLELNRPIAATYTNFTLIAMAQFVAMARHANLTPDPWSWSSDDGRSIAKAMAWPVPYMEGREWTFGTGLDKFSPELYARTFRVIGQVTGDERYLALARTRELPADDRMRLLVPLPVVGKP